MAFEPVFGFHGRQKGFLDQIPGNGNIPDSLKSKSKKNITVLIDPGFWTQQGYIIHVHTIYLTSAVVGLPVVWLMSAPSIIPFIEPFIVQIAANAILRFRSRDVDTLLLLPGGRWRPANNRIRLLNVHLFF